MKNIRFISPRASWVVSCILLLIGIAQVFYVAFLIRSDENIFPKEILISPAFIILGTWFLGGEINRQIREKRFFGFVKKISEKGYRKHARNLFILSLLSFIVPFSFEQEKEYRLQWVIENFWFYLIGNITFSILLAFFSLVNFILIRKSLET